MLSIETEHSADTVTLRCLGRIVAGAEAELLQDAVVGLADQRVITLDLGGVERIDAAGLGLLAFFQALGCAVGYELQLANPAPRVREVLGLTRLNSVLEVSGSEEAEDTGAGRFSSPAAA
jgi:anti-anti-sigma factor